MKTTLLIGIAFWIVGTIGIRLSGPALLPPDRTARAVVLFAASFLAMAVVIPWICDLLKLDRALWFQATALLILPTLLLDSLSCIFFSRVFPNLPPSAAGIFGGWMLVCCAGAVVGVWIRV